MIASGEIIVNSILYRIPPQLQRSYRSFENWDGRRMGRMIRERRPPRFDLHVLFPGYLTSIATHAWTFPISRAVHRVQLDSKCKTGNTWKDSVLIDDLKFKFNAHHIYLSLVCTGRMQIRVISYSSPFNFSTIFDSLSISRVF